MLKKQKEEDGAWVYFLTACAFVRVQRVPSPTQLKKQLQVEVLDLSLSMQALSIFVPQEIILVQIIYKLYVEYMPFQKF